MDSEISVKENILLAPYTSIGLGGVAQYFCECKSIEEIRTALLFGKKNNLPIHVLGGGTNTIFSDNGFNGLIIKIGLKGIAANGEITVSAGEVWDDFVEFCIQQNLTGIECLSGIPGLVGATPIQNVGAYGQEVSETIVRVKCIDRETLEEVVFQTKDCLFRYRESRFKSDDRNRYIIIEVVFRLKKDAPPYIRYPELQGYIEGSRLYKNDTLSLKDVRSSVLALRKKKSMIMDQHDQNSKSVGSFFLNPILSEQEFQKLKGLWKNIGNTESLPTFQAEKGIKIPAAWLIEKAGFSRGEKKKGIGISSNHTLALVNYGGTTHQLLSFAEEIRMAVQKKFGISLQQEPVIVE